MQISKLLGRNIRFLRYAAGVVARGNSFSQKEIADFLGVSRKTIVFWESGHIPSDKMMFRLSEFFNARLGLSDELTPQQFLDEDISECFFVVPERADVRRVTPAQKKLLSSVLTRASVLNENDLEKVIALIDKFSGDI